VNPYATFSLTRRTTHASKTIETPRHVDLTMKLLLDTIAWTTPLYVVEGHHLDIVTEQYRGKPDIAPRYAVLQITWASR
jgi:hypothetical protein